MQELNVIYLGQDEKFDVAIISFVIVKNGLITKTLLSHLAELPELIDWFESSYENISNDLLPIDIIEKKSISYALHNFYDSMDDDYDNDALLDKIYEYRCHHCLWFGMRGTDVPEIYFGKKNNGYEVSLYNENESWNYVFDLQKLYSSIQKLKEFI